MRVRPRLAPAFAYSASIGLHAAKPSPIVKTHGPFVSIAIEMNVPVLLRIDFPTQVFEINTNVLGTSILLC